MFLRRCPWDPTKKKDITKQGYLMKQSLHLKKMQARYIHLYLNQLLCYKYDNKTSCTDCIKLQSFQKAQSSRTDLCRFELLPKDPYKRDKIRVFVADSLHDKEGWIDAINRSINVHEKERKFKRRRQQQAHQEQIYQGMMLMYSTQGDHS